MFRTRHRRVARLLVTATCAALLTALGLLAPATAGAAPRLGQSFTVTNLTSQPQEYQGGPAPVPGTADGPAVGSILQPGQTVTFFLTYFFNENNSIEAPTSIPSAIPAEPNSTLPHWASRWRAVLVR